MSDFHKELLGEMIKDWTLVQLDEYIFQLEQRKVAMEDWIKHAKTFRRKKTRKPALENGVRGGT